MALYIVSEFKEEPKKIEVTLMDPVEEVKIDTLEIESPDILEVDSPDLSQSMNVVTDNEMAKIDEALSTELDAQVGDVEELDILEFAEVLKDVDVSAIKIKGQKATLGTFDGRNTTNREALVKKFGGTKAGQEALLRGLRWLKKNQNPDGSWNASRKPYNVSMSSLSVLAFLAYGATPSDKEFGKTVRKGLDWMLKYERDNRGQQLGKSSGYQHPIFTFAICEAAGLLPESSEIKEAMNSTVQTLLNGQSEDGGFPYIYSNRSSGLSRSALTLTGWNALALKAAFNTGCEIAEMEDAKYALIDYLKSRHVQDQGFRYGGRPSFAHRGIGSLGLQFFGQDDCAEVVNIMKVIKNDDINKTKLSQKNAHGAMPCVREFY
jgi:hypothetical protein